MPPAPRSRVNQLARTMTTGQTKADMISSRRRNHYTRPLEEAVHAHVAQWPKAWQGQNPLRGGRNFASMSPEDRVRDNVPF